jgi:uncharacterized coiled-coil DUF342 family protein|tara:strand:+ start:2181 stop:2387 length:207 start_codon:yes stop_codon:yes gene_type:complete
MSGKAIEYKIREAIDNDNKIMEELDHLRKYNKELNEQLDKSMKENIELEEQLDYYQKKHRDLFTILKR